MTTMPEIRSSGVISEIPAWAVLERRLFDALNASTLPFISRYTESDGTVKWCGPMPEARDGGDDFYESFFNWPLLYLLGGDDAILAQSVQEWHAVTRQLTRLGHVAKEYERGYDWFHQGEGNLFFYFLCIANPDVSFRIRAFRFAGFYLNEDLDAPNYDAERRLVRAPHNGSMGPRWGYSAFGQGEGPAPYEWRESMRPYGLPYLDVPGISSYDDLKVPELAVQMGDVMYERMGRGDIPANLAITSLMANAYCFTGDSKYRQWIMEYVDAWIERTRQNDGILPDNVGLSGAIGEYNNGKWWGGPYGWAWPHGFYNLGMAMIIGGTNAYLVSGQSRYLEWVRAQLDSITGRGRWESGRFLVPMRFSDAGWFDYQELDPLYAAAIWAVTGAQEDWNRMWALKDPETDWTIVAKRRNKHDGGHEKPWLEFLAGRNPGYPQMILETALGLVAERLAAIRNDTTPTESIHIHWWQLHNPVTTEALVQLTLGAPQVVYNGGLLMAPLRYYDDRSRRPGLPPDVAALVHRVTLDHVEVELVNTALNETRGVIVQAGALGEHRFVHVRTTCKGLSAAEERTSGGGVIDSPWVRVLLEPTSSVRIDFSMKRHCKPPSYRAPWEVEED